jgi:hypothetical protein
MNTNDTLHASVAASLVVANLSFSTVLAKTPEGGEARTFRLVFKIRGQDCHVIGYAGGVTLTVIAAVRVAVQPGEIVSKRHELADFIATSMPLIRLVAHPYNDTPDDENVVWVEAAIPIPPNGMAIEPWLAVTPFAAVAGAVEFLANRFAEVTPTIASSFPLRIAERSEKANPEPMEPNMSPHVPPGATFHGEG